MKFTAGNLRLSARVALVAVTLSVLFIAGCQEQVDESERIAALLAPVPADTPYLGANLHYLPDDVFQHQMSLMAPRVAEIMDVMAHIITSDPKLDAASQQRARALFDALTGYLRDETRWEQHRIVFYGQGLFPVLRAELSDAAASRNDLNQLHTDMGVEPNAVSGFNGDVFQIEADGDTPINIYYGIVGDYFIAAVLPADDEQQLAQAFGGQAPAAALDPASLDMMAEKRGYSVSFMGFVDTLKSYDALVDEDAGLLARLGQFSDEEPLPFDDVDAVCREEIREMVALVPRMEWGGTRSDKEGFASSSFFQLRQDIAQGLLDLTGDLGGLDQDSGADFSLGVSFSVGPARDFVLQMARNIQADPFQCAELQGLNMGAEQVIAQAGTPIPPFVGQIRGLKLNMNNLGQMSPTSPPEMSVALFVENAQLLMSMAQLMLPQLAQAELPMDGTPVRIDEQLSGVMPTVGEASIYAALTESAIGVALGDQQVELLPPMMAEEGGDSGILFASWVDYGALLEMQTRLEEQMAASMADQQADMSMDHGAMDNDAMDEPAMDDETPADAMTDDMMADAGAEPDAAGDADEATGEEEKIRALREARVQELSKAVMSIYEVLNRAGSTVRPTAEGLVIEQTVSFKQPE